MVDEYFIPYSYIGEVAGFVMGMLVLLIMLYTKPRKSFVYKYVFWGIVVSILSVLVHISIIYVANNPETAFDPYLFMGQILLFLIFYNAILYFIFSYVNMMSIVRRKQRREFLIMYAVLSGIYLIGVIVEIAARRFYTLTVDGIDISHFVKFYCTAGVVCAVICFNATLTNRKDVARVIWHSVIGLAPATVFILALQILTIERLHSIFSSLTYVPVFVLGYTLFHSNPYDEVTGCQNIYGLIAYLDKNIGRKKMYISYISLKFPNVEDFGKNMDDYYLKGVSICRAMEAIRPKFKMFRVSENQYVNLIECKDDGQFRNCINSIRGILDGVKADLNIPFNYVIISGEVIPDIESAFKCRQYFEFMSRRFKDQNSSHFYVLEPTDYDDFMDVYEVSLALEDIRNRLDYEDDRVVVYAQPIYDVETGRFRSAEALTRLKINGKMISPDKFIPVAENSGTIHAITCIVLDKVCKAVESLEQFYDFDAISINISSKEISQKNIKTELLDIIEKYDFDVSKIRLEITESAMFEDYDRANDNMEAITKSGIQFYLDDFGTGYSSFERVINCPVKTIKFDKALLYKALDDNRMDDIMSYMIEVFKKNGYVTLVEGVEDESQSQYSLERGFDYIQGFHYAKPEPIENMKNYFDRKKKF